MAQHIVALDIGKSAARVAVISATFRRATLLGVDDVAIAPNATPAEVLTLVRERIGFPIDSLICSLDARRASVRMLHFPFGEQKRLAQAVQFELDGQVPYDLQDLMVVWSVVERDPRRTDVLAGIAPKAMLNEQLALLNQNGFEPRCIVHPAAALAELTPAEAADEGATATVCIGATQTHVSVSRRGLRAVRTLPLGGDLIVASYAAHAHVELAKAKELLFDQDVLLDLAAVEAAAAPAKAAHRALVAALAPLLTHLSSTFKGMERNDRPQRLLLTGGGSRLKGLARYLSQRLNVPVAALDVGAALGSLQLKTRAGIEPEHAVVLGLALGMFRRAQDIPLNFRQAEMAYHGDMRLYRGFFTRIAVGFVCVFLAAFLHAGVRYMLLHREEAALTHGFCSATQSILGKEICDPGRALAALKQVGSDGGTAIPPYSATAMLEMLARRLPTELDVSFDELDVRVDGVVGQPERILARGEAASFETTEQVATLLRHDVCVQDAEVSRQHKTGTTGRVEFALQLKVACPVGVQPGMERGGSQEGT